MYGIKYYAVVSTDSGTSRHVLLIEFEGAYIGVVNETESDSRILEVTNEPHHCIHAQLCLLANIYQDEPRLYRKTYINEIGYEQEYPDFTDAEDAREMMDRHS